MGSFELFIVELSADQVGIDVRDRQPCLGGKTEPRPGFNHVSVDTVTIHITSAERVLRQREAGVGRAGPELDAGWNIARHTALATPIEDAEIVGRTGFAGSGGFFPPHSRLREITRLAHAAEIHETEFVSSTHIALPRSSLEPGARLRCIRRHAFAVQIEQGEIVLGFAEALLGCASIPLRGLGRIGDHPPAFLIAHAEVKLRCCVTCACQGLELSDGQTIVTATKSCEAGGKISLRQRTQQHTQKGRKQGETSRPMPHYR